MKRVLILTREFPPHVYGGAGVHVEFLSRELAKLASVEVRAFGGQHDSGGAGRPVVRGFELSGDELQELDPRLRKAVEPLGIAVKTISSPVHADVVHCHTWYSMMAGFWLKTLYGLPLAITTHSLEPLRPWKREQLGRGYDLSSWIERTALEAADAVIAVSSATQREVLECYGLDPGKVHVIHNGIDLSLYRKTDPADTLRRYATKYGFSPEKPYVLFVGRITRQKGVVHLVRALEHISEEMQAILCAGAPDTREIQEEMEAAVARVQAKRSGVYWVPEMVPVQDIVALYSGASIFVCPSVYEPFGIINLEAMACETPVVATAVGGIPEAVADGETGILVPFEPLPGSAEPRDPERFARDLGGAVNRLISDPDLRRRMGAAGRRRVEERFSWESVARQTLDLYERLVGEKPVRSEKGEVRSEKGEVRSEKGEVRSEK